MTRPALVPVSAKRRCQSGSIAIAQFGIGSRWVPDRLSGGEAVLAVLANTVPAQERPEEALRAIRRAIDGAVILQGVRGEASDVVPELLDGVGAEPRAGDPPSNGQ